MRKLTLEERLDRIESTIRRNRSFRRRTNEGIADTLIKIAPIFIKNVLPALLDKVPQELPKFIKALKNDTANDNTEKIDLLTQLGEVCTKLKDAFKDFGK